MHSPEIIRESFKRYLKNDCRNFSPDARRSIIAKYDESVKRGCEPLAALGNYLEEFCNHGADEVLAKYHASGSLLNDKEKSRYAEHIERLQKKFKMDKLSLVGMDETPVTQTTTKENELTTSPEIAIGHEKNVRFKNKTILFAIEIR